MRARVVIGALALSLFPLIPTSPTLAAVKVKPVKMVSLPILAENKYFQGAGGQWFSTLISSHSIYLIGTSEPAGAPTQGEVISIDPATGSQQWDLPIPTTTDAIASAATLDQQGNIWVAGIAGAPISSTSPSPAPSNALNPSGVTVDPTPPTRSDLTQVTLWEVSPNGAMINSFSYDVGSVVEPLTINYVKGSFLIQGSNFKISVTQTGRFTNFTKASFVPLKIPAISIFKDGLYIWKSFTSKKAIPGVTGWKPTTSTPVILKIGSRTGKVYEAYKVQNPILKIVAQTGTGLVVTTATENGYAISLLK